MGVVAISKVTPSAPIEINPHVGDEVPARYGYETERSFEKAVRDAKRAGAKLKEAEAARLAEYLGTIEKRKGGWRAPPGYTWGDDHDGIRPPSNPMPSFTTLAAFVRMRSMGRYTVTTEGDGATRVCVVRTATGYYRFLTSFLDVQDPDWTLSVQTGDVLRDNYAAIIDRARAGVPA